MATSDVLSVTQKFAALADPTRQALLQQLRKDSMAVGEIARRLPISRPAVSQHLKILRSANLVKEERHGTRHIFSLNADGFEELQSYIASMWQDALSSFAGYVRRKEAQRKRRKK